MLSLKGRSFLKLLDFTPEEITGLLDLSADLKAKKKQGIPHRLCEGKNRALVHVARLRLRVPTLVCTPYT